MRNLSLLLLTLLFACTADTQPTTGIEIVQVYASPAARPWLSELYACAGELSMGLNYDPQNAEITLLVGEPEKLVFPAFQIGAEELLIVTSRESSIPTMSLEEAQSLFEGSGDPAVHLWVYPSGSDLQQAFNGLVMQGRRSSSQAMVAIAPEHMIVELNRDSAAVGILTRRWLTDSLREVYSVGIVPVLAVTREEPTGAVQTLLECMQE